MVSELVSEIGRHSYAGIVSIGPVGVGKSSNLNTVASYMTNRLEQQAASGTGTGSLTKESVAHLITYQGRPVRWKWMDTPGDLFWVRFCMSSTLAGLLHLCKIDPLR
jgi:putative ribosome biogenesis GTPase RsgA